MGEFWLCRDPSQLKERLEFFEKWLREHWDWSKPVEWRAKPYKGKRSLDQNALFHVWCREMAQHFSARGVMVTVSDDEGEVTASMTEKDAKDLLKYRFLGTCNVTIGKTDMPAKVKETSGLDVGEMFHFMSQCQAFLVDCGVAITCPEESEYMELLRRQDA